MAKSECVLCGSPNVRFEVAGNGQILTGAHKGKEVKPGDLVCYLCMTQNMAAGADGQFVLVNEHFHG